jgi:transglutaminase-like putative cysteine protease
MYPRLIFTILFFITLFINVSANPGDSAPPGWLRSAASVTVPSYDKNVKAVVLYNEAQVTFENGNLVTTENRAVKILTREGKREAVALAYYLVSSGKVREMNAWIIRTDGSTKEYDKKSIIDSIGDTDDVYNEGRIKIIDASEDVDINFVFGYTVVSEDRPLFYDGEFLFQDDLPTLTSRYTLNLPPNWKASSLTFNYPEVKPQVSGTSYTWELRNLPPIATEPMSPSFGNLAPRIAINYSPNDASQAVDRVFANWLEFSRWASKLYDPQVIVDDAVAAKAQELTVNAKTELQKIRAIGTYVQNLQYISIDIGVGYGNGIRPRPSNLVLARGYGDCKDKANLMRAMLRALKIEAYPIVIYSGDADYVREESISWQFNHCIIAVKISDATEGATVINHPKLGRLLIFDATDPFTPVGDLPNDEQGSFALIIAGESGGLIKMPVTPSGFNGWKRNVEVSLTGDGAISGVIRDKATGQSSSAVRALFRSLSASDVNKVIEGWLTRGATAARLVKLTPTDRIADSSFDMDVEFSAPAYGQLMQNRLLVFKPAIVSRSNSIYLTELIRKNPVSLSADSFDETTVFTLPAGFIVDEMPAPVTLETAFGKYSTTYAVKENKLTFTRSLTMNRSTLSVDKYNSIRDFFSKILAAEQSPVVLMRKELH